MTKAKRARPYARLGAFVRAQIRSRGLKQKDVAERGELDQGMLTRVLNGENVYLEQYAKVAKGAGFRSVAEMFRMEPDPLTRQLLRYWTLLDDDDEARRDVLELVKRRAVFPSGPEST